ncbi:gluconate 2-dehydrogenase subunit 3 family protein [Cupriavidus basilensis]
MQPMPPAGSAMRVLDKQPKVSRRGFLRGSGLAAISVTVIPTASIAAARDVTAEKSFHTLGVDTGKTLVHMARDIYPHDKLADKFYVEAVTPYDAAAAEDSAVKMLLTDGVQNLNRRSKQRYGLPYVSVKTENERVALLKDIEPTPFFKKVQGDLVTSLYNNKKLWPLFGYEGSSWEKGRLFAPRL